MVPFNDEQEILFRKTVNCIIMPIRTQWGTDPTVNLLQVQPITFLFHNQRPGPARGLTLTPPPPTI